MYSSREVITMMNTITLLTAAWNIEDGTSVGADFCPPADFVHPDEICGGGGGGGGQNLLWIMSPTDIIR